MNLYVWRIIVVGTCLLCGLEKGARAEDICWSTYGEFQYRIVTDLGGRSFADAIAACEHENTTLTSVLSAEEDNFLQTFAMSQIGVPVWIGLYRKDENMSWVDGSEIDYFKNSYRKKAFTESCVYMFQGWIEAHCQDTELYFICKRELKDAGTCVETTSTVTATSEGLTEPSRAYTDGTSTSSTLVEDETSVDLDSIKVVSNNGTSTSPSPTESVTHTVEVLNVTKITDSNERETTEEESLEHTDYPTTTVREKPLSTSDSIKTLSTSSGIFTSKSLTTDVKHDGKVTTVSWEESFVELLDEMTVKKKPVYSTREAENSAAIGSVSVLLLLGVVFGIVLLDITTIRNHWKLFQYNTKGLCSSCRKARKQKRSEVVELVDIVEN